MTLVRNESSLPKEICYICHEGSDQYTLIENPCGFCSMKVHYNCLISHLIANWSMQEDGYSYKNCSVCRRRYPNFIIRDMLTELDALEENQSSPIRHYNNNNNADNSIVSQNNLNNIRNNENRNNIINYQRTNNFKCFETLILIVFGVLLFYYGYKMIFDFHFKNNYIYYRNNNTKLLEIVNEHNNNVVTLLIILLVLLFLRLLKKIFFNIN